MTDKELDEACNSVLHSLRDLNPSLAKSLTSELNAAKYKMLNTRDRKKQKICLLYERDPVLFKQIFAPINAAYFAEQVSPVNFFEILEKQIQPLNPHGELTGGNYRAKT